MLEDSLHMGINDSFFVAFISVSVCVRGEVVNYAKERDRPAQTLIRYVIMGKVFHLLKPQISHT